MSTAKTAEEKHIEIAIEVVEGAYKTDSEDWDRAPRYRPVVATLKRLLGRLSGEGGDRGGGQRKPTGFHFFCADCDVRQIYPPRNSCCVHCNCALPSPLPVYED